MYEGKMSKVNCSAETKINKIKYEMKKKKMKKRKKCSKMQYNTNPHHNPIKSKNKQQMAELCSQTWPYLLSGWNEVLPVVFHGIFIRNSYNLMDEKSLSKYKVKWKFGYHKEAIRIILMELMHKKFCAHEKCCPALKMEDTGQIRKK